MLSKLHSFEKKEETHIFEKKEENHIFENKDENHIFEKKEDLDNKDHVQTEAKKIQVMEPPKAPPKKVEVRPIKDLPLPTYLHM